MIATIHVRALSAAATRGLLQIGYRAIPCALGRSGQRWLKREGDGATPRGNWRLLLVYRRGGISQRGRLLGKIIRKCQGWCDAIGNRNYNRPVKLPYRASHERLWRADSFYDVVVVLSHNQRPRVWGAGSAVFLHVSECLASPTAGCVAIRRRDMLPLLERCGPGTALVIGPPGDARQKSPIRRARRSLRR